MPVHPLYLKGIEHFNAREFFEAHDVWEELWKDCHGEVRRFYQGLIQVAVALHHFGNGNIHGARKLFFTGSRYLEGYLPAYLGLDIEVFLAQLQRCFADLIVRAEERPAVKLMPVLIPRISLDADLEGK